MQDLAMKDCEYLQDCLKRRQCDGGALASCQSAIVVQEEHAAL